MTHLPSSAPKRYLLSFAATVAFGAALFTLFVVASAGHPVYGRLDGSLPGWAATVMQEKADRVEAVQSPKILLLGGSSVAFGVKTPVIAQMTGLRAFNFGIHGAMTAGTDAYLATQYARPGDVIVVAEEAPGRCCLNSYNVHAHHMSGLDFFRTLGTRRRIEYLRHLDMRFLSAAFLGSGSDGPPSVGYFQLAIDANGDLAVPADHRLAGVIGQSPIAREPGNALPVRPGPETERELARLVRWARQHDVTLVLAPPSHAAISYAPLYRPAVERMARASGAEALDLASEGRLPVALMHDTSYHPTEEGGRLHTQLLAAALCRQVVSCGSPFAEIEARSMAALRQFGAVVTPEDFSELARTPEGNWERALLADRTTVRYSALGFCRPRFEATVLPSVPDATMIVTAFGETLASIELTREDPASVSVALPGTGDGLELEITISSTLADPSATPPTSTARFSALRVAYECENAL